MPRASSKRRALRMMPLAIMLISGAAFARPAHQTGGQIGVASWYGAYHQGRRMADGTRFDAHRATAASPALPLGSWVLVRNLRNNRAMVVQICDRGPYVRGRILDLSEAAARQLGFIDDGIVLVSILPLHRPAPSNVVTFRHRK